MDYLPPGYIQRVGDKRFPRFVMLHRRPQHAPFYPTAALSPCCHAEVPTGGEFGTINRFVWIILERYSD